MYYVTLFLIVTISYTSSEIFYVDPDIAIPGSGTSWSQAFNTFDEALINAIKPEDEIWLKGGHTYYPLSIIRSSCFIAETERIKIYGGFAGFEHSPSDRPEQRAANNLETILSGDINIINDNSDNCYHVLTFSSEITIDRVTIRDGNANYRAIDGYLLTSQIEGNAINRYGGGLIASEKGSKGKISVHLNDVIFSNNYAIDGGALWIKGCGSSTFAQEIEVQITNCVFKDNTAINGKYEGGYGGAIYAYLPPSMVNISNTLFLGNRAYARGGAIYQDYGALINCDQCIFDSNIADGYGGAVFVEDRNSQSEGTITFFTQSIFRSNAATYYGGAVCVFNVAEANFLDNEFKSNIAKHGTAIALINAHNKTFPTLQQNSYAKNDDIYIEEEFIYEGLDSTLHFNMEEELLELYHRYQYIKEDEIEILLPYQPKRYRCFVDASNVRPRQNGRSWFTAYNYLQSCIDSLQITGGEVWVAAGKYIPTRVPNWKTLHGKTSKIHRSFEMYKNISMYGGFAGFERFRHERNFNDHPTYLSCELENGRYCFQILLAADNTLIDGFIFIDSGLPETIESNSIRRLKNSISVEKVLESISGNNGAGVYSNNTNIIILNTIFYKLFSSSKGGAVYCIGLSGDYINYNIKSPTLINVKFLGNRAVARGGAIAADVECEFVCKYCIFDSNSCAKKGGAIYLDFNSDPIISSSTFRNNYALESGGCLAADGLSMVTFTSVITFENNSALWEGGCLYSGSGVDLFSPQMPSTQGFFFDTTPIFENNFIRNCSNNASENIIHVGQGNIYAWPYTIVDIPFTESPTLSPTTAEPSIEPTPSPTTDYSHVVTPNFLVVIVDDMLFTKSFSDGAPQGIYLQNKTITYIDAPTPHIDKFMRESIVFSRSYSAAPKCSPSRFSLLTGRQACRSEWATIKTLATSSGIQGVNVSVATTKLFGIQDSVHNIPYQLKYNSNFTFSTGMVGKWHLLAPHDNGYDIGCSSLDKEPNAQLYSKCTDIVKTSGFDFVDALYVSNIFDHMDMSKQSFSHNPEWMVSESLKFIDNAINIEKKNFFLYFASTLTHSPSIEDALNNFTYRESPKGILRGTDVPIDSGMLSRREIWEKALRYSDAPTERTAAFLWMDEQFGALINYLKDNNLYDNTFVVFTNDHGMVAKGLLYEQGSRVMQIVRYPPKFQIHNGPYVVSDNIITGHIDIAPTIFDLANIYDPNYILDGESWITAVQSEIESQTLQIDNKKKLSKTYGTEKYMDMYNSHSVITKKWKYIFRATDEIETDTGGWLLYPNVFDSEQLYNLYSDSSEQNNLINDQKLSKTVCYFKQKMIQYINKIACPQFEDNTQKCILPNMNKCQTKIMNEIQLIEDIDNYNEVDEYDEKKKSIKFNYFKTLLNIVMKSLL